jgi:murein tripeptide amidase MpaA
MPNLSFDRYYRYDELTRILQDFARDFPAILRLDSIGKSYEGRDIWLVTLTNFSTGSDTEKPAVWVDGNIHASEVSASSACLHLIHTLTAGYGTDERITRVLDSRAYYVCPRISPDGAEWALADQPKIVRSSTRPHPYNEEPLDGLVISDVDGDGRMLLMRMPDANGQWKPHPDHPRLLVRRDPDEYGGTYYRVFPEGVLENYDGVTITVQAPKERLDLNRNFPNAWRGENEQPGAGPYPLSEPETAAVAGFVGRHKNIVIATAFHTYSGVLLRPYSMKPDSEMPAEDLWAYQKQGNVGKQMTGYPDISIFHEFKYHPNQIISGGLDWMYEHLGMFYWAVEIWSPQRQAGINEYKYIDWYREHPLEDDLAMLKWSDEALEGRGYVDWYEFDHPQLGKVELGGWDGMYAWRNPPTHLLEKEIEPFAGWFIWQGMTTPRLELLSQSVTALGGDTYRVRVAVHNTGWLPTYGTRVALQKRLVRGVIAEISLADGVTLESGKQRQELGQLEGRSGSGVSIAPWSIPNSTEDRAVVEWVVRGAAGTAISATISHERAGAVHVTIPLG